MSFSVHQASAPVFARALTNLSAMIDKALAAGVTEATLLSRLTEPAAQLTLADGLGLFDPTRLSRPEAPQPRERDYPADVARGAALLRDLDALLVANRETPLTGPGWDGQETQLLGNVRPWQLRPGRSGQPMPLWDVWTGWWQGREDAQDGDLTRLHWALNHFVNRTQTTEAELQDELDGNGAQPAAPDTAALDAAELDAAELDAAVLDLLQSLNMGYLVRCVGGWRGLPAPACRPLRHRNNRRTPVRPRPCQQLKQHHPQPIDIARRRHPLPAQLLRARIQWRQMPRRRQRPHRVQQLRRPKIQQPQVPIPGHEYVARLQIQMHHQVPVRRANRFTRRHHQPNPVRQPQPPRVAILVNRLAHHPVQNQIGLLLRRNPRVQDPANPRMVQLRQNGLLPLKPLHRLPVVQIPMQHLHRHPLPVPFGRVNRRRPTLAQ